MTNDISYKSTLTNESSMLQSGHPGHPGVNATANISPRTERELVCLLMMEESQLCVKGVTLRRECVYWQSVKVLFIIYYII